MSDYLPLVILLLGSTIIIAILARAVCRWLRIPVLVAYTLLGLAMAFIDGNGNVMTPQIDLVFEFLGGIGIVALLFRIGLESNITEMLVQLRRAVWVWLGNVGLSAVLGYLTARYLFGFTLVPSLFAATALTATSLGVCLAPWRDAKVLDTPAGGLLSDVAGLDDISGITIMIMLFSVAPVLIVGNDDLIGALVQTGSIFLIKVTFFVSFCVLFSRYLERPITAFFASIEPAPDPLLIVIGTTFVIAALAGWLGFSLAVGALFAGLMFSRDPQAVKVDASFSSIYDLFTPFFFINIGLSLDPAILGSGLWIGAVLLVVAIAGKVIGAALPARQIMGWNAALLIGVSLVPRAEIAMVVISEGRLLGDWAVPPELFSGMVVAVIATSVLAPLVVGRMLAANPPTSRL